MGTRESFKSSDANKDGKVALQEYMDYFKVVSSQAGISQKDMLGLVKQTIRVLKLAKPNISLDDAYRALFEICDLDKSGFITIDEQIAIDKIYAKVSDSPFDENDTRSTFSESDANKDGKVAFEEFVAYFKAVGERAGLPEDSLIGMVRQ